MRMPACMRTCACVLACRSDKAKRQQRMAELYGDRFGPAPGAGGSAQPPAAMQPGNSSNELRAQDSITSLGEQADSCSRWWWRGRWSEHAQPCTCSFKLNLQVGSGAACYYSPTSHGMCIQPQHSGRGGGWLLHGCCNESCPGSRRPPPTRVAVSACMHALHGPAWTGLRSARAECLAPPGSMQGCSRVHRCWHACKHAPHPAARHCSVCRCCSCCVAWRVACGVCAGGYRQLQPRRRRGAGPWLRGAAGARPAARRMAAAKVSPYPHACSHAAAPRTHDSHILHRC